MNLYQTNFERLTEKQKEAVEYINGPLLVVAGPGTGKTQLLSMRVAQILQHTDVDAYNILCLTFTNKAAANMRKRLQQLIGPDSLQVNVKTFHSLSAEIMGEYPDYFWNGAKLATAPEAVQTDIIENILSRLPLDNPLASRFAGNYTSINRVRDALKLTKEAGLTPDKLKAIIEFNLAYIDSIEDEFIDIIPPRLSYKTLNSLQQSINSLPDHRIDDHMKPLMSLSTNIKESLANAILNDADTGKTKYTGAWRNTFIQSENGSRGMYKQRRINNWWLKLADVYADYRNELHQRGYYDYSDMLIEVISQLEKEPSIRSDIQERYQYIMIDEFQDSNAAQMRLADLISSHPLDEGKPNLMVVGDDDQSIYKFNGAELSNMLNFRKIYPSTKTIILEDNFRSSQEVLDTSRQVIELAADRLVTRDTELSKNLIAKNEPREKGQIIHRSYPSKEYQLYAIAQDVSNRFHSPNEGTVAVLARQHESLQTIASELNKLDIPIRYERQNNILEHVSVQQIITICTIIHGINIGDESIVNQNISLTLGHPMWGIDRRSLWELAIGNRFKPKWLDSLLDNDDPEIKSIGDWLVWLSQESNNLKIELIIDYIIGVRQTENFVSPFKQYFMKTRPVHSEYVETLSAIQKIRSAVNEFAGGRQIKLNDFINFVNLHQQNNIPITDESIFTTSEEAVQLLTVHKAKGLEFDTVYIIDAIEKEWQPRNRSSNTPANLPLQPYGDDMDDYIRLMYVAMTRARKNIIATSYSTNTQGEEVVSSPLISGLAIQKIDQIDMPNTLEILEANTRWPQLEAVQAKDLLSHILSDFSISATSLINFLDLTKGGPDYFLERNLLRLPDARTISLAFGTAIHSALELAQRQINHGELDLEKIKRSFAHELDKEPILPSEIERWQKEGLILIENIFNKQLVMLPEGGTPEQRLTNIDIGGATIDGKLDHIIVDQEEGSILITDYKTGSPLRSFSSQDKSMQIKIWKHKTQLIFYALLASSHPLYSGKSVTCQMQYLEADNPKDITREYTPSTEEIERLAKLIRAVYGKIKDYNLPDVSKYPQDINGILQLEDDLISGNL